MITLLEIAYLQHSPHRIDAMSDNGELVFHEKNLVPSALNAGANIGASRETGRDQGTIQKNWLWER